MKKWIFSIFCLLASSFWFAELYFAWSQQQLVRLHLRTFSITEKRCDVARRLGVKMSPNGRWWSALRRSAPVNFQLGTYTNSLVVGYREMEGWPIHSTDSHGFINNNRAWKSPDVLVIGDSFVTAEHLSSTSLSQLMSQHGFKTLNLGMTGTGPVLQLAALKTYWPMMSNSVRWVIWWYYEGNDIQDLTEEYRFHRSVLDSDFVLQPNPSTLDKLPLDDWSIYGKRYAIVSILKLERTRRAISRFIGNRSEIRIFNQILDEARRVIGLERQLLLVRVHKPGWNMDSQWNHLRCNHKLDLGNDPSMFNGSLRTSHYTVSAYRTVVSNISLICGKSSNN